MEKRENLGNAKILMNHEQFNISITEDKTALIFSWKENPGLSIQDMQRGITEFADHCKTHKPARAVIDARKLDPNSPALGWVSGQKKFSGQEEYVLWWVREIVPVYQEAGIISLTVATGNPDAPGQVDSPPEVKFKMGYFNGLDDALNGNTKKKILLFH